MNTKLNHVQDWLKLAQQANWSVSKLAKRCKVSSRTLERHFLKTMSKTPKTWMTEQRQKQAIELLQDGSTVKETAAQMGFQHASAFSREFKKLSGQCPNVLALTPKTNPIQQRNVA